MRTLLQHALLVCATATSWPATAALISVNSTGNAIANDGQCTLREAVIAANTNAPSGALFGECAQGSAEPTVDTIGFNIAGAGAGVQKIVLSATLHASSSVVIDGYTQPGARPNTVATGSDAVLLIEVSGPGNVPLLLVSGPGSVVRGLILNDSNNPLTLSGANAAAEGNWIGLNPAGSGSGGSCNTGLLLTGQAQRVGGLTPAERNVIAGCVQNVRTSGNSSVIGGNYIGTNVTGTQALPTNLVANNGILVQGGAAHSIGGTVPEARNVIAAGATSGITSSQTTNLSIVGNYIGIDASGTSSLGGQGIGIFIEDSSGTMVGGTSAGSRNVISGNLVGIQLANNGAINDTQVFGNYIGSDAAGVQAVPNGTGILVSAAFIDVLKIGEPGAGNVISGNSNAGISVRGTSFAPLTHLSIVANLIGVGASGSSLPNGKSGIDIIGSETLQLPDALLDANTISRNGGFGIRFSYALRPRAVGNAIVGNGCGGVLIGGGVEWAYVGINPGGSDAGNTITGNLSGAGCGGFGGHGVLVSAQAGLAGPEPISNFIQHNSIADNSGAGIVLATAAGQPSTPNDAGDGDSGPNDLQNYPEITSVVTEGNSTRINGRLNSGANGDFWVDLFANTSCDSHGFGEGSTYLTTADVKADAVGTALIDVTIPAVPVGTVVTATATRNGVGTSEFSQCTAATPPGGLIEFASLTASGNEDDVVTLEVVRRSSTVGSVAVDYATEDGSAKAGTHYTAVTGRLTFADGETTKNIVITLPNNGVTSTGSFTVGLSNPSTGATLGRAAMTVNVSNNDSAAPGGSAGARGGNGAFDPFALAALLASVLARRRWQRAASSLCRSRAS